MDMVNSALERPDVALSKRGTIWLNRVPLRALRSFFQSHFLGFSKSDTTKIPGCNILQMMKIKFLKRRKNH